MKIKIYSKIFAAIFAVLTFAFAAPAQSPPAGAFKVGDKVEVEVIADSGKWFPATVSEIMDDGYTYKVKVAPYGDGKEVSRNIHYKRVRVSSGSSNNEENTETDSGELVFGKYGCTSTTGSAANGTYQIHPRGSFTITSGGKYTYYGYEKPSPGTFTADDAGKLYFKNGAFDGGEATPLGAGYENQFFLVYPTITDNRWKCKLIE